MVFLSVCVELTNYIAVIEHLRAQVNLEIHSLYIVIILMEDRNVLPIL